MKLRIATWNVEYAYPSRLRAIREILAAKSADIWVLTEAHDDLAPENCAFAAHSQQRPKNWPGIRSGSRWTSIWSRYPISKQIYLDGAGHVRTACGLIEIPNATPLIVYGTVLPWHSDRGGNSPETKVLPWAEHHRVIPQQVNEWLELRKRFSSIPLCVAGDFNSDMLNGARYGTANGVRLLREGLSAAGLYCSTAPERFPKSFLSVLPIDHIVLPIEWIENSTVTHAWPANPGVTSDHSGMIVEISL